MVAPVERFTEAGGGYLRRVRQTTNPLLRLRMQPRSLDPKPGEPGTATVRGTVIDSAVLAFLVVLADAPPLAQ